jgi:hypothetical protein
VERTLSPADLEFGLVFAPSPSKSSFSPPLTSAPNPPVFNHLLNDLHLTPV